MAERSDNSQVEAVLGQFQHQEFCTTAYKADDLPAECACGLFQNLDALIAAVRAALASQSTSTEEVDGV